MLQQINKIKIYFYIFSFLFLTTLINQNLFLKINNNFLLKNIIVKSDTIETENEIRLSFDDLVNINIFLINKKLIKKKIENLLYLENISVKKKYPSTIIINAKKTDLIAVTFLDQKKYYVGNNGKLILSKNISDNKKLPIIFGKFEVNNFIELNNKLEKNGLDINKIIRYYYHKNKRWDLFFDNDIVIRLPNKELINAIKLFQNFKKNNAIKPNTTIDLRIENRLILKNG